MGRYVPEGLACPYHGLRFDRAGRCVGFPARPDARLPKRLDLDVVEARERHGLIWARLEADFDTEPPDWSTFDRDEMQRFQLGPVRWRVSASRVAENFNDLAHFSTIHRETFGSSDFCMSAFSWNALSSRGRLVFDSTILSSPNDCSL